MAWFASQTGNRIVEVVGLSRRDLIDLYATYEVLDGLAAETMADRGLDDETRALLAKFLGGIEPAGAPFRRHEYFSRTSSSTPPSWSAAATECSRRNCRSCA